MEFQTSTRSGKRPLKRSHDTSAATATKELNGAVASICLPVHISTSSTAAGSSGACTTPEQSSSSNVVWVEGPSRFTTVTTNNVLTALETADTVEVSTTDGQLLHYSTGDGDEYTQQVSALSTGNIEKAKFNNQALELLIELYTPIAKRYHAAKNLFSKKKVFQPVLEAMHKAGVQMDGIEMRKKYNRLIRDYIACKERIAGGSRVTCRFYDSIERALNKLDDEHDTPSNSRCVVEAKSAVNSESNAACPYGQIVLERNETLYESEQRIASAAEDDDGQDRYSNDLCCFTDDAIILLIQLYAPVVERYNAVATKQAKKEIFRPVLDGMQSAGYTMGAITMRRKYNRLLRKYNACLQDSTGVKTYRFKYFDTFERAFGKVDESEGKKVKPTVSHKYLHNIGISPFKVSSVLKKKLKPEEKFKLPQRDPEKRKLELLEEEVAAKKSFMTQMLELERQKVHLLQQLVNKQT